MADPLAEPSRKDLETKGLDAKDTVEHVLDQLVLCLDATDDPDADTRKVQDRYSDLAEKLRRAADELDD
jgi:predicted phage-related endonuclease